MRRARFYLLILAVTLLPQALAARDLIRFLSARGGPLAALGWSLPGLLLVLNLPMAFEVLRRKHRLALPRALAGALQTLWTCFWLGSVLYAVLLGLWFLGAGLASLVAGGPLAAMPGWVALSPFALALYGTLFGARVLRRERVTVPVAGLPSAFEGLRIVQLSDLHSGRHITRQRLQRIARRAARLKPDLVVVTGDIVHNSTDFAQQAAEAIGSIPSALGVYACLGNHDFWAGADAVAGALRTAGVKVLRNQGVLLQRGGEGLWLCGVDDPWSDRFDLGAALRGRPEGAATVLLSHQPNTWPLAQRAGVHLQLSGHTHGGQIALLWLHRSLSLARLITPFVAGLYRAGASYLYVNRGAGSVMPMVRIGARPEVTELTLVAGGTAAAVAAEELAEPEAAASQA